MAFYDLDKQSRADLVKEIERQIVSDLEADKLDNTLAYFSDEDTYIRKCAYIGTGRIYFARPDLHTSVLKMLRVLAGHEDFRVRQTVINAAGEIGKKNFEEVRQFFDEGLFDQHHSPRNAVIGSIKKMGEVNPKPILSWAKRYLHHKDKEIRREICHGIELRGRKFPQDILPLLQELEFDKTARVRDTLIHVIGQISYKEGCLSTVVAHLRKWKNQELVRKALLEIIDVHVRYKDFADMSQKAASDYIYSYFKKP